MWWHSWEMWGRGRFRKIRKSKQKERKRRRLNGELSNSKIYIKADPVDLNPIFNDPRTVRKYYIRLPREDEVIPDFGGLDDPFKVCWIDNFIKDEQFLDDLINFVAAGPYMKRDNDLFTYHQINDEIFMSNPLTQRLLTSLVTSVIPFMRIVVGRELNEEKVSISASKYCYTDHLLCHDDKIDDRRIAFIIYLNKRWERTWGGTLDLFRRDNLKDPGGITASLVPRFNRMIFFEVTAFSFHQVSKVLKDGAERISVNGWFHYPRPIVQRGVDEPELCHSINELTH